jgi:hypothetical protein
MTETKSLVIMHDLIEKLQPIVCCSDSQATCRDDAFCSSEASEWPYIQNGHKKVRLVYPESGKPDSLPATAGFCSAYMDWYAETGCGALAKEIAQSLPEKSSCPASVDPEQLIESILGNTYKSQRTKVESLLRRGAAQMVKMHTDRCAESNEKIEEIKGRMFDRCGIMYDGDASNNVYNSHRADDLENIADFCVQVQNAEDEKFNWGAFVKGGGVIGGLYLLGKVIKGVVNAGKYISWAGTGVDTITHGLRHIFYVSLPNFKNTIKSIFTGKKAPEMKTDEDLNVAADKAVEVAADVDPSAATDTQSSSVSVGVVAKPHNDVVLVQLANLTKSARYDGEGDIFVNLPEEVQGYLVDLAMQQWGDAPPLKQARLAADDSRLTEGKLPIDFLLKFARHYLNDKMVPIIQTSARVWAERKAVGGGVVTSPQAPANFQPNVEEVLIQLISNNPLASESSYVQEYLTYKTISNWNEMSPSMQGTFIGKKDDPTYGGLPQNYIRLVRKHTRRHSKIVRGSATVFGQIIRRVPQIADQPFELIEARAKKLTELWGNLPGDIRKGFLAMDGTPVVNQNPSMLPISYIEQMRPSILAGIEYRDAAASAAGVYRGYDLGDMMMSLSGHNKELATQSELLESIAVGIVEAWIQLPNEMKDLFLREDGVSIQSDSSSVEISWRFVNLHAMLAVTIGRNEAEVKKAGDGGEDPSGQSGQAPPTGTPSGSSMGDPAGDLGFNPVLVNRTASQPSQARRGHDPEMDSSSYRGRIPDSFFAPQKMNMLEDDRPVLMMGIDASIYGAMSLSDPAVILPVVAPGGVAVGGLTAVAR